MARVVLESLSKVYSQKSGPGVSGIRELNLTIEDGEFMVLVGPSGCGKTTSLRMIAGLEDITDGTLSIGDKVVNDIAPKDRDIAMVFQNYALYPHMSVYENLAFGLRLGRRPPDEVARRVGEMLAVVDLAGYERRQIRRQMAAERRAARATA